MTIRAGGLLAFACLILGSIQPAAAFTYGSATNLPVTQTINVQIIDVCGTSGGCAPTSPVAAYESFANAIYNQAGMAFSFNPTIKMIHVAGTSTCGGGAASTFCADSTTSGLFDTVHTLIDTRGHGQSDVANTLNVYLVKNLIATTNGVPTALPIYGWGLIGGNGAAIMTGQSPLTHLIASPDVLAHELGHNLGLTHVDQPPLSVTHPETDNPLNLMNTGSRLVSARLCLVTPVTCSGSALPSLDELAKYQIKTLLNPLLLNQLPAVEAALPGGAGSLHGIPERSCGTPFVSCQTGVGYIGPVSASLTGLQFRFLKPGVGATLSGTMGGVITKTISTPSGVHETISVGLQPAWNIDSPGFFSPTFTYSPCSDSGCPFAVPFSTEFDFSNGITSEAGFDGTGYLSQEGQIFGFNPFAPGVVHCAPGVFPCSILPLTGVPEDTDGFGMSPGAVGGIIPPLSFPVPAPEPGSALLLLAGIGGLAALRKRR